MASQSAATPWLFDDGLHGARHVDQRRDARSADYGALLDLSEEAATRFTRLCAERAPRPPWTGPSAPPGLPTPWRSPRAAARPRGDRRRNPVRAAGLLQPRVPAAGDVVLPDGDAGPELHRRPPAGRVPADLRRPGRHQTTSRSPGRAAPTPTRRPAGAPSWAASMPSGCPGWRPAWRCRRWWPAPS